MYSQLNRPSGSAEHNRGVLGLKSSANGISDPPNTIGVFWGYNPPPMGPRVPPNLIVVFWGYKSTANGPSGSAEHNYYILGLQIPRQWALRFR
ncbi:Hypothetical protein FKW44_000649 [Caligus rogercresseyi]|uniref:Uncharacterized protein n=1 Tax=Caligus rogercresseyi TaxID=217165 RepID=A0A7T8KHW9_CALRO|nr:Hypothetical protein FKW44_000649 [Caligus rogercresseyi]